ncbi:permease for cytosine/purines, uracil, thiamine, allantoin-domain-containing protein [Aspergillus bertholletiae]|uniref:Permease for cytosine/purines, uracil, thiamine, allantoin-domain-containing protein n=1 Tax=Aspergillus bertholletiae TaxID=1226010 RepID=A0A5N7B5G3_9EURO|nr:permease for cytosine/purines, uracil, thiamine, allantoin-domain-containing protein [Aspergillus bertholletiae]
MSLLKRSIKILEVPKEPGLTTAELMLTNEDLKPVEPERRQWGWLNFVAFWIADSLNVNTWMISSAMIVDGLSWWQSWLCVWAGYTISGIFVVALGRIATIYHIPFAVANRSSFGVWGSFWPVLNRAAMAVIWYGVQMMANFVLGQCVTLMIQAIWPSYVNIPNGIPASTGVTTMEFTSFFLFWLGSLPALWFPIYKIRHLFTVKAYFSPACAIAFFIWAIVRAHGLGPIIHQPNTAQGSALAWAVVKSIMNCIANFAALIINNPDFSRYARKPRDAIWSQLITIPAGFAVTSFIGIVVTSSSTVIFGEAVWNPLILLGKFLEDASSAERFGVFVIASGFALAQLGTNIAANSVSAGTNLTALLPRFCTIRRGAYICAGIGLAMCPWYLVSSSNKFTVYLSSYSVFLSSIAGVMVSDYYLVRRGYLEIQALYSAEKDGPYYGTWGVSWRGYTAYICGILINVVGFAGAVGADVPMAAEYIYNINYLSGFIVAAVIYWALAKAFPIPCVSETWNEVPYLGAARHSQGKDIAKAEEVEDIRGEV